MKYKNLIYIITYNCNFRCSYCDIFKHKDSISYDTIDNSIEFIKNNNINIKNIKFFGGEPLLEKDKIKYIINNFPKINKKNIFITTNISLVENDFIRFLQKYNFYLTFSIDGKGNTFTERHIIDKNIKIKDLINKVRLYKDFIRINQVITPKNVGLFFENFYYLYSLGVRNFNFLPTYYKSWSKEFLKDLYKGFNKIRDFYLKGNYFNLINLNNFSKTSFFNEGLVIDTDGKIFLTNLFLSGKFQKYKKELVLGDIKDNYLNLNDISYNKYISIIDNIIRKEYNKNILKSVKYIDDILNNFVLKFKNDF